MNTMDVHYATHLGPIYAWMVGDLEAALADDGVFAATFSGMVRVVARKRSRSNLINFR